MADAHPPGPFTIWCNTAFPEPVMERLMQAMGAHRLVLPPLLQTSNLALGDPDPLLAVADVAFGQPDPLQVIASDRLRWVQLTTAGYTRYDTPALRDALGRRGGILTNSSSVYDEPCAEHAMAMMLALARQLPAMWREQAEAGWRSAEHRRASRLLVGQTVLLYGYGAIGRRLAEMLEPMRMNVIGVRRHPRGDERVRTVRTEHADALLPTADHIVDLLPAAAGTTLYFNVERFSRMKQGAVFYNIGRGTTVDQMALLDALERGALSGAYIDVTEPEPLPKDHPLWRAPNCYITPHTAGGEEGEFARLAEHFMDNLRRFERGEPLVGRVI